MNAQGGCFSIFRRADDVTRTMSKGGASGVPPIQVQTPPPTWLAGYGPVKVGNLCRTHQLRPEVEHQNGGAETKTACTQETRHQLYLSHTRIIQNTKKKGKEGTATRNASKYGAVV